MMMSAIALKRRNPNASDDEIREYLIGNFCRCTGYESQAQVFVNSYKEVYNEAHW